MADSVKTGFSDAARLQSWSARRSKAAILTTSCWSLVRLPEVAATNFAGATMVPFGGHLGLEPVSADIRTSLCSPARIPPGKGLARPETSGENPRGEDRRRYFRRWWERTHRHACVERCF
jgi:hypothetical protein